PTKGGDRRNSSEPLFGIFGPSSRVSSHDSDVSTTQNHENIQARTKPGVSHSDARRCRDPTQPEAIYWYLTTTKPSRRGDQIKETTMPQQERAESHPRTFE